MLNPNIMGSDGYAASHGDSTPALAKGFSNQKEAPPRTVQAACWTDPNLGVSNLPEYLHLGKVTSSELELTTWFGDQFNYWTMTYGSPGSKPTGAWKGRPPPAL